MNLKRPFYRWVIYFLHVGNKTSLETVLKTVKPFSTGTTSMVVLCDRNQRPLRTLFRTSRSPTVEGVPKTSPRPR